MRTRLLVVVLATLATLATLAAVAGLACRSGIGPDPAPVRAPSETELLRGALTARCGGDVSPALRLRCDQARRLYAPELRPLWWTSQGPSPQARALATALRNAATRGLDPAHYASGLAHGVERGSANASPVAGAEWAARDVALSLAALRFVSDLEVGRVAPHEAGFALVPEAEAHDLLADVAALAHARDVDALLVSIEPPFESYRLLVSALARYRRLVLDPTLALPPSPQGALLGEPLARAAVFYRRLAALGDLPVGPAPTDPGVHADTLAAGVAQFQRRHGITPDGVLGPATTAALAVPFETRVLQLELALERFRWLPHQFAAPPLAVNIPEFRLFALREQGDRYVRADDQLSMRVIVGEAWQRQTPVFSSEIQSVVFWPFWDVPSSIAKRELLPKIERDPEYLSREAFELIEGYGAAPKPLAPSVENLDRLAANALRLRQRPGPNNAMGPVKFLFPNPYHVYLHGTPARRLFGLDQRDLSHGCIRVEDPLALALYVLRNEPEWTRERIDSALVGPRTHEVRLAHRVPIYVVYVTAVAHADGSVHFFPDLYGLDSLLSELLEALPSDA